VIGEDEVTSPGVTHEELEAKHHAQRRETAARIARVCHEANRTYSVQLGDLSHVEWERCSKDLRDSAINGVLLMLDRPDTSAEELHEEWCDARREAGWVWGPVKDEERKTHPNLAPYDELPPEQQTKDRLFRAIVQALAR
jgi:hypothetical protein